MGEKHEKNTDKSCNINSNCNNVNKYRSLTSLDLSDFDTSSVERMNVMFYGCNSLTELDLSKFKMKGLYSLI